MGPCTHGYVSPLSCVECMYDGNLPTVPAPARLTVEHTGHVARFDGHCSGCNLGIHRGQAVARLSDGTWRHDECVEGIPYAVRSTT